MRKILNQLQKLEIIHSKNLKQIYEDELSLRGIILQTHHDEKLWGAIQKHNQNTQFKIDAEKNRHANAVAKLKGEK